MTSSDRHPDFLRCKPERRWNGSLAMLFMELCREASRSRPSKDELAADKGWQWRVLAHGAFVGVRKRADVAPSSSARLELRIARSGELKPEVRSRFDAEVGVFLQHFQIQAVTGETPAMVPHVYWVRLEPAESDAGKPVARFLSLLMGEIRPGTALCWDCLQRGERVEIPWEAPFGAHGQACQSCALQRGERERIERARVPAEQSTLGL